MIITGQEIVKRRVIDNLLDTSHQIQPCGVDMTLRQVSQWTSAAVVDFDNTKRQGAKTAVVLFSDDGTDASVVLPPGTYLVDFNETVKVPRNCMGTVYPRSSLWRSGVGIMAGVVDAGYQGAMGALMEVRNPGGIILHRNARLAQIVFQEMGQTVEGYKGIYQSSTSSAGQDGTGRQMLEQ